MAKIAPPTNKKAVKKEIVTTKPTAAIEQTPPDSIKPLQLKLPELTKNEFKAYAGIRGISMKKLFIQMFEEYKENHKEVEVEQE